MAGKTRAEVRELLERLLDDQREASPMRARTDGSSAQDLRQAFDMLAAKGLFRRGDLVQWKPGLRNRAFPNYGEPLVVVDVLDSPLVERDDESEPHYFREPLTLIGGLLGPGGELLLYHFDKRRFEAYGQR